MIEAAAGLAEVLLRNCPHLRILASSREALGVPGEQVWRVPPLALPEEPDSVVDLAALGRSEAVQLFITRTQTIAGRPVGQQLRLL